MWRCEDVRMRRCEDEQMWRWADMKMRRWEDVKMRKCEDVRMRRCEDEQMWRCECVKMMRRCENEKMWRWEDVCEDVRMWMCEDDEKMWRWEDMKMRRCEDEKMWRCEDVKMIRCEDERQTPTIGRTRRSDALGKKTLAFTRFSKNWRSWCERNPVNNSVVSTFKDKNCGIYAGSCHLTAKNAVNYSTFGAVYVQVLNRRCFHMFLAFFNKKRRYRLTLDDSVARKKAGGRRREDST